MDQNTLHKEDSLPSYAQVTYPQGHNHKTGVPAAEYEMDTSERYQSETTTSRYYNDVATAARYEMASGYVTTNRRDLPQTIQPSPSGNSSSNKVTFSLKTCFVILVLAVALNFIIVVIFGGVLFHLQATSATKSDVEQLIAAQIGSQEGLLMSTDSISPTTTTMKSTFISTTVATSSQTPPSWFTGNTQLCFRWRAEVRSFQCGDHRNMELCANVGTYTTNYRDDTDDRPGGCRMQWSIRSPLADEQFDDVQICYRWAPDGDANQCGGGANSTLCAPVGSYTSEYLDATDNRPGGCQMSWMLSVPADSPQWLKDVKLCYRWFPDGDRGQCGGSLTNRELCAQANSWTTFYTDDTNNRGGGCQMAWKLM